MAKLRISEAQVLYEALGDPVLKLTLQAFCNEQREELVENLLRQLKLSTRDTMKEAQLAGKIEAYETALMHLVHFAQKSVREAIQ